MKTFDIKLDKARKLKLTNSSIMQLEKMLGTDEDPKTIFDVIDFGKASNVTNGAAFEALPLISKLASIHVLSKVIYCGLLHYKEDDLTFDNVIDMIPMGKSIELAGVCLDMILDAYGMAGEPEEKKEAPPSLKAE